MTRFAVCLVLLAACDCGDPMSDLDAELDTGIDVEPDMPTDASDGSAADTAERCVPSGDETCNGLDDDCDGRADESFLLRCVMRDSGESESIEAELTGDGFDEGVVRNILRGDDRGIALPMLPDRSEFIWVAASAEDQLSKIRIADGVEVGRFAVGDNPSRTAVDGNGDAWVAMRGSISDDGDAGETWENVVKVDGHCTPALLPPMPTRECILLDIAEVGNLLRGVAIDARGDAWVGSHAEGEVIHLDRDTGEVLERIAMEPFARPYGLAIDEAGYIWVAAREGEVNILRIDPATSEVDLALESSVDLERLTPYGLAADGDGGVWFGSATREVFRIDRESGEMTHNHLVGRATRGVAVDDLGRVWAADSFLDQVLAIDAASGEVVHAVDVGNGPVGVAIDHDGFVWAANQFSDSVTRVDPMSGEVLGSFGVGRVPYTYSDMTGSAFRVFRQLRGVFRASYHVGAPGAHWTRMRFEGSVGIDSEATFRFRAADDEGALALEPWSEFEVVDESTELDLRGAYLEVEVELITESREMPPFVERMIFDVEYP